MKIALKDIKGLTIGNKGFYINPALHDYRLGYAEGWNEACDDWLERQLEVEICGTCRDGNVLTWVEDHYEKSKCPYCNHGLIIRAVERGDS